jgi:hypothetical protein
MDGTRVEDLKTLDNHINNARSSGERRELEQVKQTIIDKSKDRRLTEMRRRLVNATRNGNGNDSRRIAEEIKRYEARL